MLCKMRILQLFYRISLYQLKCDIQVKTDLKEAEHDREDVFGMGPQMFISWDSMDDLQDEFP